MLMVTVTHSPFGIMLTSLITKRIFPLNPEDAVIMIRPASSGMLRFTEICRLSLIEVRFPVFKDL